MGGSGPVVVLVHGLEARWQSWRALNQHLDAGYRVVALDLPWRAGNDYRWRRTATAGAWLARALGEIGAPDLAVIAHSFGATALLEVLVRFAQPVRAAMLVAPFYRAQSTALSWATFDAARRQFDHVIADDIRGRLGGRLNRAEPDVLVAMAAKIAERIGPLAFATFFEEFAASGCLPLARVVAPCLVLAGASDPSVMSGGAAALAEAIPAARLVVEERFDHFCHVHEAAAIATYARDMFAPIRVGLTASRCGKGKEGG